MYPKQTEMKQLTYFLSFLFMCSCAEQTIKYPLTQKTDVKDTYFGTEVEDPYRWLENDTSGKQANGWPLKTR
jgi:prolyl oligopeptidase